MSLEMAPSKVESPKFTSSIPFTHIRHTQLLGNQGDPLMQKKSLSCVFVKPFVIYTLQTVGKKMSFNKWGMQLLSREQTALSWYEDRLTTKNCCTFCYLSTDFDKQSCSSQLIWVTCGCTTAWTSTCCSLLGEWSQSCQSSLCESTLCDQFYFLFL